MTTAEHVDFEVPSIGQRDDLVLATTFGVAGRVGSIAAAAGRTAEVAHLVLGVDKQAAEDTFTGQLEAMGQTEIPDNLVPVVHLTMGAEDANGRMWTPSHVIRGHDALQPKNGQTVPDTYVWPEMYTNRPADWWNKTRPESAGQSELVEAPLQIVLADVALRGTNKKWNKQQAELAKLIQKGSGSETVTVEGMPILAWAMMDADAIIHGTQRPDTETFNRFVQHERDRRDADDWLCGPDARVVGDRAGLSRSGDGADSDIGFRSVMGQKRSD